MNNYENYEDYYNGFNGTKQQQRISYLLLYIRNYWLDIIEFDNLTGYALSKGLIDIVNNNLDQNNLNGLDNHKDYLSYILQDFIIAFNHIVEDINKKMVKENQLVHISKAKEFNSKTISWLSKQSGSNIIDKLSNTNYKINSGVKYNSIDMAENRLFKASIKILELYLNEKAEAINLGGQEEYYYNELFKFLKSDLSSEIGLWENTPPNNTLLSHKNYKVVWKTWQKLNRLDEILYDDNNNINNKFTIVFFIKICTILHLNLNAKFPQVLLNFDFDEFNLTVKELEAYKFIRFIINSNELDFIECSISFNKNKIVLNIGNYQTSLSIKNKKYSDKDKDKKAVRDEKISCYAVIEDKKVKIENQAEIKVESQAESKVESQAESKVESQAESKVESQAESKVESQSESKVESQEESRVESKVESQAEIKVESQAESKVESQAEIKVESQEESRVESKVESQSESKVENQAESREESQVESQAENKVESQEESREESQAEIKVESQAESRVESKVENQAESKVESQAESKVESQAEIKVESQVESRVESKEESQAEIKVESQAEIKVESQAEIKVESQVESQAESKVESQVEISNKKDVYKKFINNKNIDSICTEFLKRSMKEFYNKYYKDYNHNYYNYNYDYTGKHAIIDMSRITPNFIINNDFNNIKSLNKKLMVLKVDGDNNLDLNNAKVLKSGSEVISFYSMINNLDNNFKEMSYFGSIISNKLDLKRVDYVLPDVFSELQLIDINKELGLSLKNASWFPKSIGIVFDWQFSSNFKNSGFKDKDFVLVVDILDNKLLLSIVRGSFEAKLKKDIPETNGIIWERYPIKVIEINLKYFNYKGIIKNILKENNCNVQDANWLISSLHKEVLLQEDLFIDCNKSWFYNSNKIRQKIQQKLKIDVADKIVNNLDLNMLEINQKSKTKIHILFASNMLEFKNNKNNKFKLITDYRYNKNSAIVGCAKYKIYQKETEYKLWINRLPSLAIKLPYGKFQLIKDLKVDFEIGKKHTQEIEGKFTLPKDLDKYKFPIISEDGTEASEYELTLESKEFPLEEDVICNLIMTYEYGAINPYKLIFKPIEEHKDKLKPIIAKWQKLTSYNNQNLKAPMFRPNENWSLFTRYPRDKGYGTSDLLDWTLRVLKEIHNIYNTINTYELNKDYAEIKLRSSNYQKIAINNYKFIFNKNKTILINFKSFKLHERNSEELKKNCIAYINFNNNSLNMFGRGYSSRRLIDPNYDHTINNLDDIQVLNMGSFNFFPFHTIFFNNRNIALDDLYYKNILDMYLPSVFGMYNITQNNEVKDYLFSILSLMASYHPEQVCKLALKHIDYKLANLKTKKNRILKNLHDKDIRFIMRCIGNLEHECQVELFEKLKEEESGVGNIKLIISLGEVLWKNENLIFNLDQDFVIELFKISVQKLKENIERLKSNKKYSSCNPKLDIISQLEFILSCFRLRDQEKNQNFQALNQKFELSRNNKIIKNLYNTLEAFTEYCLENKIKLDSKIKIDLKNVENEYKHIPTLLYATLLTIVGENIDISISGSTE